MSWERRALERLGCPYRPGGRDALHGLDCLGFVLDVYGLPDIASRRQSETQVRNLIDRHFQEVGAAQCGDLLVMRRASRWHFAVRVQAGFAHADIRARRTLLRQGDLPWPLFGTYRRISWRH